MTCSERVIVEYVVTSWTHRDPPLGSGTRTQHTSSALPISRAATRAMISCSSSVCSNMGFLLTVITSNRKWLPAGAAGTVTNLVRVLEGNTEGPKAQLPVPD